MPIDYTENVWNALYRFPGHPGHPDADGSGVIQGATSLNVIRGFLDAAATRRDWLTGYGLDNNARTIHIGPSTGLFMQYLYDAGTTDVWGVESSSYLWANTNLFQPDVAARIVQATVGVDSTSAIQSLFQAAGMSNPRTGDWIIDEDAISSQLDDAGILAFLAGCEDLLQGNAKGRIIHLVSPAPGRDTQILWKDMATWKAYAPDHTWVDLRGDGTPS